MSFWLIFFILSILVQTWAVERNCDSSDGYIRDHQDNVTDNCDYACGWAQCGDVCINAYSGSWCYCGEEKLRLQLYSGYDYCCVDHSPGNSLTQCIVSKNGWGNGFCRHGRVVSMGDTCNNHFFNDYETSSVVGRWSHYRCGDHQCVLAKFMCRGYPQCPDSRDVSECNEDLKCRLIPDISHNRSVLVSELSGGHQYCDYDAYRNDGAYDTITREDETDLNILSRKMQINYTSITECKSTPLNLPGLMCGENCLWFRSWCVKSIGGGTCGKYNFTSENKQLCANTTFWAGRTCDDFYNTGRKAAVGRRCTGANQHCIYPWYTSSITNYVVNYCQAQVQVPNPLSQQAPNPDP